MVQGFLYKMKTIEQTGYKTVVRDLGLISYEKAYAQQREDLNNLLAGGVQTIILCEHEPVITLGRMAKEQHVLVSADELLRRGVEIKKVDRGGDVTLHCPGQLVVYPILDLAYYGKDIHFYLHALEQVAIDFLRSFGIVANRKNGLTGVWVGEEKIGSIGIGIKKWKTYHGLALNVNTDNQLFSWIKPCGLDVAMTSMSVLLKQKVDEGVVKEKMLRQLSRQFSLDFV